jgi:formylglycine-generating enzyme required for sulfatase activity
VKKLLLAACLLLAGYSHYLSGELRDEKKRNSSLADISRQIMFGSTVLTGTAEGLLEPHGSFKECHSCPEMVVLPAGSFVMGATPKDRNHPKDEGPPRTVTLAARFAVSKYEVTYEQWEACVAFNGCRHIPDEWLRRGGGQPVTNISWDDAKQYVSWLSAMTGKTYRLLSEAEWEYAARAGSQADYSWGNSKGTGLANCRGCGSNWDNARAGPVGSFKPNAFGLHDMHGNVREWVEDIWHPSYIGAPVDGSARVDGRHIDRRVLRGGSWFDDPSALRSAYRSWFPTYARLEYIGFRVARDIDGGSRD